MWHHSSAKPVIEFVDHIGTQLDWVVTGVN